MADDDFQRLLSAVAAHRVEPDPAFVDSLMAAIDTELTRPEPRRATKPALPSAYLHEESIMTIATADPHRRTRRTWMAVAAAAAAVLLAVVGVSLLQDSDESRPVRVTNDAEAPSATASYARGLRGAYDPFHSAAISYYSSCAKYWAPMSLPACQQKAATTRVATQELLDVLDGVEPPAASAALHTRIRASLAAMLVPLDATGTAPDFQTARTYSGEFLKAWDCQAFKAYNSTVPAPQQLLLPSYVEC